MARRIKRSDIFAPCPEGGSHDAQVNSVLTSHAHLGQARSLVEMRCTKCRARLKGQQYHVNVLRRIMANELRMWHLQNYLPRLGP